MCGRFTLKSPVEDLVGLFDLERDTAPLDPRFNVAPTQTVAAICNWQPRQLEFLRWGLIPGWAASASEGSRHINARSETVADKTLFRGCLSRRRCLVLADGFYEWKRDGKSRVPMYFESATREPFAFAGLWNGWLAPTGDLVRSVCILTQEADEVVSPVHHRMPVILPRELHAAWLDRDLRDLSALTALLRDAPGPSLRSHPVSDRVNSPRHDDPACIERCSPGGTLPLFPDL